MSGVQFFGLKTVFAVLLITKAQKVFSQGSEPHRIEVEGAQCNVVIDDGLSFFGARALNAVERG